MSGTRVVIGLTLVLICLAGWAVRIVGGQSEGPATPPSLETPADPGFRPPKLFVPPAVPPTPAGDEETPSKLPPSPAAIHDAPISHSIEAAEVRADAGVTRDSPCVSLEWIVPPVNKVGQPMNVQLVAKNLSAGPVQQVVVRSRVAAGVQVNNVEPKAHVDGNALAWNLGTLTPGQERKMEMSLTAEARGEVPCQAWVTFTGSSVTRLIVREPKLVVKAAGPDKVLLGDHATLNLTVSNPGDGQADRVKVEVRLSEGLDSKRGKTVQVDVGNLAANESRTVQIVCATKAGGSQKCEVVAAAEGNLTARAQTVVMVTTPKLELEAHGPKLRYLDRPASYVFKVANTGSAPAGNVTITEQLPQGFKFSAASEGGRHDASTRTISWFVGDLNPGQHREVKLDVIAANAGEHRHKISALASRGLRTEAEVATRVEGLSAMLMELVDTDDPVEVGADTTYEIRVTNTGSKTETNLQLTCMLPEKMELRAAQGVNGLRHRMEGQHIIFEPLPKLAPRADAVYRIKVIGKAPGDFRFRTRITADGLTDPVHKEESTKVYGDDGVVQASDR